MFSTYPTVSVCPPSVCPSVCLSVHLFIHHQSSDLDVSKMNEPIALQIGISGPWVKEMT